jgi:FtsZ-interacting cell division protein ZipA
MSELQAALLAIGIGVVLAVYVYGWWKQRQYRKRFGEVFGQGQDDALYSASASDMPVGVMHEIVNMDALEETSDLDIAHSEAAQPCMLLDPRSDFIIELHLAEPGSAALLYGLWQRRFDFNKPLQVCGLNARTGQWDRVVPEGQALYAQFKIALQMLDRSGIISLAKLKDFHDLVTGIAKQIGADVRLPDIEEAYRIAQSFDAFCAEVDQMVGINLMTSGARQLSGEKIAEAASLQGMKLEADGAFHLFDHAGNSLMALSNRETVPFQHHALPSLVSSSLTLMLDVPRVQDPVAGFDRMVQVAHTLADDLQLNLVDDNRVPLTDAGLARIRAQIAQVEAGMCEKDLTPGSAQANRIFS